MTALSVRKQVFERCSITSSRAFDEVVSSIRAALGHPNLAELFRRISMARTLSDMESIVEKNVGPNGLMMFLELDAGDVLRKETGSNTPKMIRLLIGNPLTM